MKILVVGGGGREHTIVWKLSQSKSVDEIICAPGNGGISKLAKCVNIKATDIEGIVNLAKAEKVDMVVVAPDDPLVMGMVNALEKEGICAFGPRAEAAIIEGSKAFSKELMKKYNIPTAKYECFEDKEAAIEYVKKQGAPIVVKASGLALGKGVIVAQTEEEAIDAVNDIMGEKVFGDAGNTVVIEECLFGPEVSVLAFTDGKTLYPMVSAQDHKRAYDNDEGLNTGGMGTFSPSRIFNDELLKRCTEEIFMPTMNALNAENRVFKGVIYFGLMITKDGPKVIEYNARFGDPETQVVLPRLKTDLFEIFKAITDERLGEINVEWYDNAAVCVVMASGGYPGKYTTGYEITGLDSLPEDITVFHAGTKLENDKFLTSGGRVIGITATGKDLDEAIKKAYDGVKMVSFENAHYRKDIGIKKYNI
ncbi:MAG: phosphoribosylamine--glycine ligase [Ruminococcaceae bacterium]|nr:phosphoribosylamine--glycine ligase [Oscillospiraceae bacterium]